MSHDITGSMFYSFKEEAWHGLGYVSDHDETAVGVIDSHFGGGYFIRLEPVTVTYNGAPQETGDYAIVRGATWEDFTEQVFGYVTGRFKPVQLRSVAETYDRMVNKPVETFGVLSDGRLVFLTWKMPTVEVVKWEHSRYGGISVGLDNKRGGKLFTCDTRVVCANTLSMAEGWAETKKKNRKQGEEMEGMIYKGTKTNPDMLEHLGYWMKAVVERSEKESDTLTNLFRKFAETPVKNDAEVHEILYEAFPASGQLGFYPAELRTAKEERMAKADESADKIRTGIYQLFAGAGTDITPDLYGVMNATSEFLCHKYPSKKDIAESVMFGNRAEMMQSVMNVLKARV